LLASGLCFIFTAANKKASGNGHSTLPPMSTTWLDANPPARTHTDYPSQPC